jgi:hypothetical protein
MILQTSPAKEPGEVVNSLPPIKNPTTPLASGDTVSEPWLMEVASVGEVNALVQKQVEALAARVAALEAKLNEIAPKHIAPESEPSESHQGEAVKSSQPEETATNKKESHAKNEGQKEHAAPSKASSPENDAAPRQGPVATAPAHNDSKPKG